MKLNEFTHIKLAGVTQHDAQEVIRQIILEAGHNEFDLVREPTNPFDENAVRVDCYTMYIGYIPKDLSAHIARIMDSGGKLRAQLRRINKSPYHATLGLTVDIVEVNLNDARQ